MAKKAQEPQQVAEGIDISELMTGDELNPALAQIYSELGGDGEKRVTVYVYLLNDTSGKEARVWQGPPDDYDLMALAKRFGSGDYRVKIYAPTERGNPGVRANQVIPILLDPADDARIVAMRRGDIPLVAGVPPVQSSSDMARMIAEAVRAAMPVQVAAPDPLAMMDRLASVMQKIIPQTAPAAHADGFKETLSNIGGLMSLVKQLSGGDDSPRDRGGRVDKEGFLLTKGAAIVERLFEKHLSENPKPPSTDQSVSEPDQQPQLTPEQIAEIEEMRLALMYVLRKAKAGNAPEEVADLIYDDVPDELFVELYNNPQWFETLCANEPGFIPFKDWCIKLRAKLLEFAAEDKLLTADGKLAQAAEDDDINAGNAATDATGAAKQ